MLQSIITAILAFVSTNIDDIFVLMLFFGLRKYSTSQIFAGQYIGIFTLVAISVLGAFVGALIDPRYIGLLGLFPIYLAIKQIIEVTKAKRETSEELHVSEKMQGTFAVAGVTIANGGDNIGVYVPLLSTLKREGMPILLVVFAAMVLLWCLIAQYLAQHRLLAISLNRYAHIVMPLVLFALGIFILYESDSLTLLF